MHFVFMFDEIKLVEQWKQCICILLKFKLEFEFAIHLQYSPFKWNNSHISDTCIKFQPSTHGFVHCTYYASMFVVCRIEVEPEPEATPFVEDTVCEPRQQGKQPPPIDHVDKIPLPSQSRLRIV